MKTDIARILKISDPDAEITELICDDDEMIEYVFIEKKECSMYCSDCGHRMLSKGVRTRMVNHPALQTGYKMILAVKVRKWFCPACRKYDHDHFQFVEDGKRNTLFTVWLLLDKMKSLEVTARHVARELNVSDTYVFETFMMMVNMPRLPFSDIISVDEVHMKFDNDDLYAVIIMDFRTSQIIDILPNRYKETYEDYFLHIPREERKNVKIIISDIYKPYLKFPDNYFPDSHSIIDSYHVVSYILTFVRRYIVQVKRKYKERDQKRLEEKNEKTNSSNKTIKKSREVKILEQFDWFMLKNYDDINFTPYYRKTRYGSYWFEPAAAEKSFLELDPNFKKIRDLKERYIRFNKNHINDPAGAEKELRKIISEYRDSGIAMYKTIAETLSNYIPEIAASFHYISDTDKYNRKTEILRRLSNGPIEGFNVNPKTLKRLSRGVSNFEYTRNRILWATREGASVLAIPRDRKTIHKVAKKKRGPYKKKGKTDDEQK